MAKPNENQAVLAGLHGNARAGVYTEPLWGIPYNLYIPFFTLYQFALGVQDRQIGLLISIGLVFQMVTAFFGGILTDYLGRRKTTMIFDLISWSVPMVIYAFAQNFWWFMAAAILNSLFYIPLVSWNCLLVEESKPEHVLPIYTWITVSGLLAVFFSPLAGLLVGLLGLVKAMRIIFMLSTVLMTSKFLLMYRYTRETGHGLQRRAEVRQASWRETLRGYGPLVKKMLRQSSLLMVLGIMVILQITSTITSNFLALYATQNLGIPQPWLAWFPLVRSTVMLIFIFAVQNRLNRVSYLWPLLCGLGIYILSQVLLILAAQSIWLLALYILTDALAFALVVPRKDTLVAEKLDAQDRAKMLSLLYIAMTGLVAPFGWIAGTLSAWHRGWPFALNLCLYVLCIGLIVLTQLGKRKRMG